MLNSSNHPTVQLPRVPLTQMSAMGGLPEPAGMLYGHPCAYACNVRLGETSASNLLR